MEESMLKVSQVAKRLGVTPPTVRRMLKSGRLAGIQISPTTWRVPADVLERYISDAMGKTEEIENSQDSPVQTASECMNNA